MINLLSLLYRGKPAVVESDEAEGDEVENETSFEDMSFYEEIKQEEGEGDADESNEVVSDNDEGNDADSENEEGDEADENSDTHVVINIDDIPMIVVPRTMLDSNITEYVRDVRQKYEGADTQIFLNRIGENRCSLTSLNTNWIIRYPRTIHVISWYPVAIVI